MVRRTLVVLALAAGLAPVLALPGQAAPSGGCPNPANSPVLSIGLTPATLIAGASSTAFGKFTLNSCAITGASVALRHRALVNGQPSGSWGRVSTVSTNAKGAWHMATSPMHNEQVQAVFRAAGAYPTTFSKVMTLGVRDQLTIARTNFGKCKVLIDGQTSPVKANRRVFVQSRGPSGHFKGWTTMFESRTNAKGKYSVLTPLSCGSTYNLSVSIAHDASNLAGRSRTIFGIKPTS
jgi:hypothetical protein